MRRWQIGLIKAVVWAACLAPLAWLAARLFRIAGPIVADPAFDFVHTLGKTGLNILLITLAITPVRVLTGFNLLARFRRLLGLFAFFYLSLHFAAFATFDLQFNFGLIFGEIVLRPYLTIGMLALVLMIPLAVTSTRGMQRRLGRRWTLLHRLIYPIGILGVWHFWWHGKQASNEPVIYAGILAALLGYRVWRSWQRHRRRQAAGEGIGRASTP
jgi:sulfoxide reductase heme-binding subunit YedZ